MYAHLDMYNKKAVSPVVGFIMIVAILVCFMALLQSQFLPMWNKKVERKSQSRLISEVSEIPHILTGSTSTPFKLDLGTIYPKYPFLFSPPPTAGYIKFLPENVMINATISGTNQKYNVSFKTYAILVHPFYVYSPDIQLIYEYTTVLENGSNYYKAIPVVNQTAFSKATICIPIINSTYKVISGVTVPLNFYLISKSYGISLDNVNVTFEVKNPDYWRSILDSIYGRSNVSVSGNTVTIHAGKITLYTPAWVVSATNSSIRVNRTIYAVVPLNNPVYVGVGNVAPVNVMVVDNFGNPISGVTINSTVKGTNVSVLPSTSETNLQGVATFYVEGLSYGNENINFTAGKVNSSVEVHVFALPAPVTPTVSSISLKGNLTLYSYNSSTYTYTGTLNATAVVYGSALGNVPVTITLSVLYYRGGGNSSFLVTSSTVYTNTVYTNKGIASINNVSVKIPLLTTITYKYAYTQLSARAGSVTVSYTNTTSIGRTGGGTVSTITTPATIYYP